MQKGQWIYKITKTIRGIRGCILWGGVFEQLARYTTRYQESDLHLAFILLNLLTTSTYTASLSVLPTSLLLLYFAQFRYSSGFNSQSWTCLGQLTGRVSIVFLIANTATGLLLSGNRLAYAATADRYQVTKVSSNTTNTTTCDIPKMAISKFAS